jgi:hypothetical protein
MRYLGFLAAAIGLCYGLDAKMVSPAVKAPKELAKRDKTEDVKRSKGVKPHVGWSLEIPVGAEFNALPASIGYWAYAATKFKASLADFLGSTLCHARIKSSPTDFGCDVSALFDAGVKVSTGIGYTPDCFLTTACYPAPKISICAIGNSKEVEVTYAPFALLKGGLIDLRGFQNTLHLGTVFRDLSSSVCKLTFGLSAAEYLPLNVDSYEGTASIVLRLASSTKLKFGARSRTIVDVEDAQLAKVRLTHRFGHATKCGIGCALWSKAEGRRVPAPQSTGYNGSCTLLARHSLNDYVSVSGQITTSNCIQRTKGKLEVVLKLPYHRNLR